MVVKSDFYSDIDMNDNNASNLARKKYHEILSTKGGNQFFKFGVGKKVGAKLSQILGWNQSLTHYG